MLELAHVFFSSLSYIPYALLVYVCLVFAPALAFFPRLIQKPIYFIGIPIISLLINSFLAAVLFKLQWYSHSVVLVLSVGFTGIAVIRQYFYYVQHRFEDWQKNDFYILAINGVALIPLFVMCGMSAFMDNDALLSWNAWAQYYHGSVSSPVFLSANGYPPFLPLLLSYIYTFLGTTLYQGVAKTVVAVFLFVAWNGIAFAGKISRKSGLLFIVYLMMIYFTFIQGMGYRFYSLGYADPLLMSCLTLAVLYVSLYSEERDKFVLLLAVLTTIAASLSKQPGFLWALFSFPLILITRMVKAKHINWPEIFAIFAAIIPVLGWVLGPGWHFAQNTGVIQASTGSNVIHVASLFSALWSSVIKFWIESPYVLLLYVWSFFAIRKNVTLKLIFYSYVIPGTVLWFMFGSYDLRLGLQLLSICAVLIAYQEFPPLNNIIPYKSFNYKRIFQIFMGLGIFSFIFFSINENFVEHSLVHGHIYPLNGPKTIIYHYYDNDGSWVYQEIYLHPEKKLWIANWYIAPLFKNNNSIITPPDTNNIQQIYENILATQPDYLFAGDYPGGFRPEDAFKKLVTVCPFLFKEHPLTKQDSTLGYNYRIYLFQPSVKNQASCQKKLSLLKGEKV